MAELNRHANQRVTVSIVSPSSADSRDDGYVCLEVRDAASSEALVVVEIPAGRWWRLCQGGQQEWPALVSSHLDRVGLHLETATVEVPKPLDGDTRKDQHRDVWKAVQEQRPDWEDFQDFSVRRSNRGWYAVVRRWVRKAGADG